MRKHALLTAIALAAVVPMGHAASQASAALSDFRFQLEDLDLFDGVAASYNWLKDATSGTTSLSAVAADRAGDASSTKNKGQAFYQYGVNGGSDHAESAALIGSWSVAANGWANGGNANFSASAATGQSGAGVLGDLLLAPHARLTIKAKASVLLSASDPGGAGSDWAKALASLGLTYSDASGASHAFVDSLASTVSAGGYYDYILNPSTRKMEMKWVSGASQADSRDRDLTVVFENTSSQVQLASLTLLAKVSGVGADVVTPAIPEPESAWFALVGVGVWGGATRRARRHSKG